MLSTLSTTACAQAQDEASTEIDVPELVVMNVAEGDVLNMRAEPNANAAIVGMLAPNAGGIHATGEESPSLDWIEVEANGATGWVNDRYLGFATYYEPLPIRMVCSGTEPFWGMELSYTRADVTYAFRDEDFSTEFSAPDSPLNRITIWVRTRVEDETDFLVLEAGTCSDGMSEIAYPYSLLAKLDGNLLGGCCR